MLGRDTHLQLRSTDIGSFPLRNVDPVQYAQGASDLEDGNDTKAAEYFTHCHTSMFQRKLVALGPNLSVPCYVQSSYDRDMVTQFLDPIVRKGQGLAKQGDKYLWNGSPIKLSTQHARIAEMVALERTAKSLCEELDLDYIQYRACVTGPFELTLRLWRGMGISSHYEEAFIEAFTLIVKGYMQNAGISMKYLKPEILTLDEPSMGVTGVGDFFTDSPSDPYLSHLISCWNSIYSAIPKGCYRGLHLHASPFRELAKANWTLLEAHSDVIVNRDWLINHDRYLRAAIMRTDGPTIPPNADLKTVWADIQSGNYYPYLQSSANMHTYLKAAIDRYTVNRIPFAGPECGLGSWDWPYGDVMVLESFKRVQDVINEFNQESD
ncbi:MAG: hypothetical protein ACFE89_13075 [Candidatus Hodarchaeota archaeon]